MISHKHRCIFIHIPKAAGTAVETFFLNDLGLHFEDKLPLLLGKSTNMYMPPRVISHLTAEEMVAQHYISKALFDEYFKFSVIRHPLDRLFSTYNYWGYSTVISFDTFLRYIFPKLMNTDTRRFFLKPQTCFLMDANKKLLVNHLCRFENLDEDFQYVRNHLKLPDGKLPRVNSSGKHISLLRGLKKIVETPSLLSKISIVRTRDKKISSEAREIFMRTYEEDLQNFGYSLD